MTTTHTQPAGCDLDSLRDLIANDGFAMSFQSMGQYRAALIAAARAAQAPTGLQDEQGLADEGLDYLLQYIPVPAARVAAQCKVAELRAAQAPQGDTRQGVPVAYLHQVVCGDGEPDQALSFAPDNFPLAGTLGYRSLSHQPLYLATPAAHTRTPADEWAEFETWHAKKYPCDPLTGPSAALRWSGFQAARATQGAGTAPVDKHLPGWERGIATVTMNGHQLRAALDFINPDGDDDEDQRDNELTFGIVAHKDDAGKESTGLCCWNDDTDGVLPLDGAPDDQKFDREAERLARAAGLGGGRINPNATSVLDIFLDDPAPVSTAAAPTCKPAQAAPEAPACTGCDPAEGFCRACREAERNAAPEAPATEQQAATTASAGSKPYNCARCGNGEGYYHEAHCEHATTKVRAPSRAADGQQGASRAALDAIFAAIDEAQRMNRYNESSFEIGKRVARLKCLADEYRAALARAPLPAQADGQAVDDARDAGGANG